MDSDTPTGVAGPERLCFVAPESERYEVRVVSLGREPGAYRAIWSLQPRASDEEGWCQQGLEVFTAAQSRWNAGEVQPEIAEDFSLSQRLFVRAGESRLAGLAARQAGLLREALGESDQALVHLRQSLELLRGDDHVEETVRALHLLGLRLLDGDLSEAETVLEEARSIAEANNSQCALGTALNNLGLVAKARGDLYGAAERYRSSLGKMIPHCDPSKIAATRINLGALLVAQGRPREALRHLEAARSSLERLSRRADRYVTDYYLNVGWARYLLGRINGDTTEFDAALDAYRQALDNLEEPRSAAVEAAIWDRRGTVYRALKQLPRAEAAFLRAIELAEEAGMARGLAGAQANLGWTLLDQSRFDDAREYLRESEVFFQAFGDPDALAFVKAGLARVAAAEGDLIRARQWIEASLAEVRTERMAASRRGYLTDPHILESSYTGLYLKLLVELAAVQPSSDHLERGFEVQDLARARSLVEILYESELEIEDHRSDSSREEEARLRLAVYRVQQELASASSSRREFLARALDDLLASWIELRAQGRREIAEFVSLGAERPASAAMIQRMLGPETVVMSLALGEDESFLFVLSEDSLKVERLPARAEIETQARLVYHSFSSLQPRVRRQAVLDAIRLSDLLFEGVWPLEGIERLVFVGDGFLQYLPVAALPVPGSAPSDDVPRLVDELEIVHAPSASVLHVLRNREQGRGQASRTVAVLADPVFSATDPRVEGADRNLPAAPESQDLRRLPYSRREAVAIMGWVPGTSKRLILDFEAERGTVLSGVLNDYRILHFATHALFNERFPRLSGIALSRVDSKGSPHEGDLHLQDLLELELRADLVVLSACRTALGERIRGNGVSGLTQGFFLAGATRLVVSLWDVDDMATAKLMELFYEQLFLHQQPPGAALRHAQASLREIPEWNSPYFWAPFVLLGDWRPLPGTDQQLVPEGY